jgi:hypothetical protein
MKPIQTLEAVDAGGTARVKSSTGKLRVTYLAGSGHTGSTLLAILLGAHPQVVSVGETSIKPKIRRRGDGAVQKCSCGTMIAECSFWRRVFESVNRQGFEFSASCWSNDYRMEHPLMYKLLNRHSAHKPLRRFQEWAADHLPIHAGRVEHVGRVNVAFIRALLDVGNADVFFDTSKRTMRLSRLLKLPELDVKVIKWVRDVRGYAASAKRRGESVLGACHDWKHTQDVVEELTADLPEDRKMLVRYEELCGRVEETLGRLYTFMEVEPLNTLPLLEQQQHHVIGNSMRFGEKIQVRLDESWRTRLTSDEQKQVLDIAGSRNRELGYA